LASICNFWFFFNLIIMLSSLHPLMYDVRASEEKWERGSAGAREQKGREQRREQVDEGVSKWTKARESEQRRVRRERLKSAELRRKSLAKPRSCSSLLHRISTVRTDTPLFTHVCGASTPLSIVHTAPPLPPPPLLTHVWQVTTPKIIKMRRFNDTWPIVVGLRLLIFCILGWVKWSRFLTPSKFRLATAKWKLVIGLSVIQFIEMTISVYTLDEEPGLHCIMILVIFNFTPVRLTTKAPVCVCVYATWLVWYMWFTYSFEAGEQYKDLWAYPKEEGFLKISFGCTLCAMNVMPLGTTGFFVFLQVFIVFLREGHMSKNLLAIKIGEARSKLIAKHNK